MSKCVEGSMAPEMGGSLVVERLVDVEDEAIFVTPLSSAEHPSVGGGLPAICREPAAKPARAVCQMQSGAAAQPIAAVVTSESSHALWAEAGVRAFQRASTPSGQKQTGVHFQQMTKCLIGDSLCLLTMRHFLKCWNGHPRQNELRFGNYSNRIYRLQ